MYLTYKNEKVEIPLTVGSFYIGNNPKCLVQLDFEDPSEIYSLEVFDKYFILKSLNPIHQIVYNSQSFTDVKVEKDCDLKMNELMIHAEFMASSAGTGIQGGQIKINQSHADISKATSSNLPPVPSHDLNVENDIKSEVEAEPVRASVQTFSNMVEQTRLVNVNGDVEESRMGQLVNIDNMFCDIQFEESEQALFREPNDIDLNIDVEKYIDYEDKELIDSPVTRDAGVKSVEMKWFHNGVLLSQQYFPYSLDKIYLTKTKESRKFFKVPAVEVGEQYLLLSKDSKSDKDIYELKVPETSLLSIWKNGAFLENKSEKSILLEEEQTAVLTFGLNQIVLDISYAPTTLEKPKFFVFDEQLIKYLAVGFASIIIPFLLILLITHTPDESLKKREEVVVIYKKRVADTSSKITSKTQSTNEASQPQAKTETNELTKPNQPKKADKPQKQEVANARQNNIPQEKNQTREQPSKSVAKTASQTNQQTKPVAKSYSFNTASQFKALLGTSSNTVAKEVDNKKSFVAEGTSGTVLSKSTTAGELSKVNAQAKGFEGAEVGGVDRNFGTSGLSGKSGFETAYMESQTKVLGAIDPNLIRKILREYIPQFRYCYHQELRKDANMAGVFDLEFKIDANGKGRDVNIITKGQDFSKEGVGCIQNVISLIQFPQVKGGGFVEVVQPLNFQSTKR